MSPASAGSLEVERYIGACLISQNRSKNVAVPRNNRNGNRDFGPDIYQQQQQRVNFRLQRCQSVDGWAGGMPLISFTNHPRRAKEVNRVEETNNPLARLAVHTQGAPLILSKSYNHRKNNVHRNANPKAFDHSKKQHYQPNKCQQDQQSAGVDTVSVTSDESSGSNNSEACLPRIIKPRKRRKKDRKPPLLGRPNGQDGFSTDSASPDVDNTQINVLPFESYLPFNYNPYRLCESPKLIDRFHLLGDISETPKLHHSFEDIKEPNDDGKDINGNQSTCQCRYCDPSGQIWDVDRDCYSPFLTPPNSKTFQFPNLSSTSSISINCLEHSMSSISLEEEDKPFKSPSLSACRDLEVSTEIVTSLNGHRDLEIKFFTLSSTDAAGRGKVCDSKNVFEAEKCIVNSANCGFLCEE